MLLTKYEIIYNCEKILHNLQRHQITYGLLKITTGDKG